MKKSTFKKRQARLATATQQINRQVNKDLALLKLQLDKETRAHEETKKELEATKKKLQEAYRSDKKHTKQRDQALKVAEQFRTKIKGLQTLVKEQKTRLAKSGPFNPDNFKAFRKAGATAGNRLDRKYPGFAAAIRQIGNDDTVTLFIYDHYCLQHIIGAKMMYKEDEYYVFDSDYTLLAEAAWRIHKVKLPGIDLYEYHQEG